jgi:hypothetical protein
MSGLNNMSLPTEQEKNPPGDQAYCKIPNKRIKIGISAQSPLGNECRVKFGDFEIMRNAYDNIRKAQ